MNTEHTTEHATVEGRGRLAHLLAQSKGLSESRRREIMATAERHQRSAAKPKPRSSGLDAVADLHRGRALLKARRDAASKGQRVPALTGADLRLLARAVDEEIRFEQSLPRRRR